MAEPGPLTRALIGQFSRPHGPAGWLAGRIMAARDSNLLRNRWTVSLMNLQPTHRVLEIGHGPGLALTEVCARLSGGAVVGLDHSPQMHRMAAARNRTAIASGLLTLRTGSAEDSGIFDDPVLAGRFDGIFAVNVAQFWSDPIAVLRRLAGWVTRDGGIYLTFQPRTGDRIDAAALAVAERMAGQMHDAGLGVVRIERLATLSPMTVCVIGSVNR